MKKTLDLGTTKISKLLLSFSIPCIISMLINSVYNIVDQIFIGQGVGFVGNAATNVIFPIVIFANAIAGLLGNGCAANLSLRLGEGKEKEASASVGATITFSIVLSILLSIILYLLLPTLVGWFGCTESVYPYALEYGRIIILGLPFMIVYTVIAAIIRADGSPKYSMNLLVVGAIANIGLDALFILKMHQGVVGGALATVLGQILSCIIALAYLKKFKTIHVTKKDYHLSKSIWKTMSMGLSSFITQGTILALFIFMNNIMTKYGALSKFGSDIPLSVYGVISKLNNLFVSSVLGIAIGAQPIIGYNYGAGNLERVKETLKKVLMINFGIGLLFNLSFLLFPVELVSLFGSADNELYLEFAVECCRIFLMVCSLNAFEMSSSIMIQSLGNVKKATAVSFIRQIVLFIPITLLLTSKIGLYGALYAGPCADILCFIAVIFIFGSEYRKLQKSMKTTPATQSYEPLLSLKDSHLVITIAREYGSGGRYVGKLLAEKLNIPFYDREIIALATQESGFTEAFIQAKEQQKKDIGISEYNAEDQIFIAETKVIEKVAQSSCVIVGRCADAILQNHDHLLRLFLYSSEENKLQRAIKYYQLTDKDAIKKMKNIDKQRAKHYKYYTGEEWRDLTHYDLAINVDSLGVFETTEMLYQLVQKQEQKM